MFRLVVHRVGILALAAGLIIPATLAQAQQQQQPQQPAPEVDASEEEVDHVAELLVTIEEVQLEYQDRLRKTEDSEKAKSIQQEMKEAIDQTIEEYEGLSSDRYDKIVRAAQSDNELKDQILTLVNEKREERRSQGN